MQCDFYALRFGRCGLSRAQTAALLGVSERTIKRWDRAGTAPRAAVLALTLYAGDLGAIHDDFRGWAISRALGVLTLPNGDQVRPGLIYGYTFTAQLARAQAREIKRLEEELQKKDQARSLVDARSFQYR